MEVCDWDVGDTHLLVEDVTTENIRLEDVTGRLKSLMPSAERALSIKAAAR